MRGNASFSRKLHLFLQRSRIGVHETLVVEQRGSAHRGVGVFTRDACSEGTGLVVAPCRNLVSASTLATSSPFSFDAARPLLGIDRAPSPIVETLMDGSGDGSGGPAWWVELVWRVALERSRSPSPLWGWIDSLPSPAAFAAQHEAVIAHARAACPGLLHQYLDQHHQLAAAADWWFGELQELVAMPSRPLFGWALRVVLSRSVELLTVDGRTRTVRAAPAIVPVVDMVNSSNACLHPALFGDDDGDAPHPSRAALETAMRANPHLLRSSESGRGGSAAAAGTAPPQLRSARLAAATALVEGLSRFQLPNARLEVAEALEDLPRWYVEEQREDALADALPAMVLSLTRPTAAADEVLLNYHHSFGIDEGALNRHDLQAIHLWARYGMVPGG